MKTYKKYGVIVADATQSLTTKVTANDIKNATPCDDRECALAQSLHRKKTVESVSVGANFVYVKYYGHAIIERFSMVTEDRKMVHAYDKAGYFRPCTITLVPPSVSKQIGARAGQKSGTGNRKGKAATALNRNLPTRHVRMPG